MKFGFNKTAQLIAFVGLGAMSQVALAYVGPGAGLSAIGSVVALVLVVVVAIAGFLWYPLKRLFGKKNSTVNSDVVEDDTDMPTTPASDK